MQIFNGIISEMRSRLEDLKDKKKLQTLKIKKPLKWPEEERHNIILEQDTGIELGSPDDESVSFLIWTNDISLVNDNTINIIGKDISKRDKGRMPFVKAVIIGGRDFNDENSYERYREMSLARYNLSLKGYMMRAVSQYMREWSRISKDAIKKGFSLKILGSSLLGEYKAKDYINSAEIIMSVYPEEIMYFKELGHRSMKFINAMRKMEEELSFECDECEYQNICGEVSELKDMREKIIRNKK